MPDDAETLRYVNIAQDCLRRIDANVRLRGYKYTGEDEYVALSLCVAEELGMARIALALAGSVELDGGA